jgi:hypothetical protein
MQRKNFWDCLTEFKQYLPLQLSKIGMRVLVRYLDATIKGNLPTPTLVDKYFVIVILKFFEVWNLFQTLIWNWTVSTYANVTQDTYTRLHLWHTEMRKYSTRWRTCSTQIINFSLLKFTNCLQFQPLNWSLIFIQFIS